MSTTVAPVVQFPDSSALPGTEPKTVPAPLSNTTFPRRADGSVDWRAVALQTPELLYVKKEAQEKVAALLAKPIHEIANLPPEDIAKVPDRFLVIRKAGIQRLARLRGFMSAIPEVKHAARDYVVVQTTLEWNEFEGEPTKVSGGVGEAHEQNTTRMGGMYLAATAENRAFSRAVRQFLEIDIVSSDELGGDGIEPDWKQSSSGGSGAGSAAAEDSGPALAVGTPQYTLKQWADQTKLSVDKVKAYAIARWNEETAVIAADPNAKRTVIEADPTGVTTWADFKPRDCLTLVTAIQKARELETLASAERFSFDLVKKSAIVRWTDFQTGKVEKRMIESDPNLWTTWFDIHFRDCITLIGLIKLAKETRTANKAELKAADAQAATTPAPQAPATPAPAKKGRKSSPPPSTGTEGQVAA